MADGRIERIAKKILYLWALVFSAIWSFIAGWIFVFALLDMIGATHFGYPWAALPVSAFLSFLGLLALHFLSRWKLKGTFDRYETVQLKFFEFAGRNSLK